MINAYASKLTGSRVDFDNRIISGIVVMTVGKAFGHCDVDATTLEQFAALVGKEKIRGRENHPDDVAGESTITKKLEDIRGFFFNFRIEGGKLLADYKALSDNANKDSTRLLHLAAEAPEVFGVSPVFFGNPEKNMARVSKVVAIDFVDIPAGDDANQQLFKGVFPMADETKETAKSAEAVKPPFSVSADKNGKFVLKCGDADIKAGSEYALEFPKTDDLPAKKDTTDSIKAADEENDTKDDAINRNTKSKLADEMAADVDDKAATAKDITKAGAKLFSHTDLRNALAEGRKEAIKYAADFDAVMDSCNLTGTDRDAFKKSHFLKGEKFGIEYVRDFAQEVMKFRAKAVGGGYGASSNPEVAKNVERWENNAGLRRMWGVETEEKTADSYKAGFVKYSASLAAANEKLKHQTI